METCYLLLGSNTGNRLNYIRQAALSMALYAGNIMDHSSVYETEPWGFENGTAFLNQVIEVQTSLGPDELINKIMQAELELGRVRIINEAGYSDRSIDIDLLFFGQQIINRPGLIVPHPLMHQRMFTLVPMSEIAPEFIHPVFKKNIMQLITECPDRLKVKKLES
jgi:2-amino-4-hydroxy-6-hydroxymethyldihydropteridine diphosphokinase